ncbi:hypothetical protein AMATHDRAFT_153465 [Amanita thiersii Skay4041]|uniref:Hydrophobin n=1 Tax=Amanita thiersii Skay4041 TaxID=703135 RepID=A0A2A9NGS1_9AGAR|nr:hypothetical protein AMATHDRAFT_153465 [Amanita thiersii Skay4041]
MFISRIFILTASVAGCALAGSGRTHGTNTAAACNTGPVECCNQLAPVHSAEGRQIAHMVGLDVGSLTGFIGADCTPITVGVSSGTNCRTSPVCCDHNNINGGVSVGCTPVNLSA